MTKEELDFIGSMNLCDEISNEAYEKIVCHVEETEISDDCVSRAEVKKIAKEMFLEVANMDLDIHTISDCISYTSSKCRQVLEDKLQALPSVKPTQCIAEVKFSKDDLREICNERIEIACEHGTCKDCIYHGINKEHTDIDGARYCSSFRVYTGYDFYCAEFEMRGSE